MLIALLFLVGGAALGFAGAYWYLSQAPAPTPSAPFDVSTVAVSPGGPPAAPMPSGSASATPAPRLPPNTVTLPSLNSTASIEYLGVADGELLLPEATRVTLYQGGAYPGDPRGTVLIAGHVNNATLAKGALFDLAQIQPNATVWVSDSEGRAYEYRITKLRTQVKSMLPSDIFTRDGAARIVIVTCGGNVTQTATGRHYDSNVIAEGIPTGRTS